MTNAQFVCGKAEDIIVDVFKNMPRKTKIIGIMDPPRAGLRKYNYREKKEEKKRKKVRKRRKVTGKKEREEGKKKKKEGRERKRERGREEKEGERIKEKQRKGKRKKEEKILISYIVILLFEYCKF